MMRSYTAATRTFQEEKVRAETEKFKVGKIYILCRLHIASFRYLSFFYSNNTIMSFIVYCD